FFYLKLLRTQLEVFFCPCGGKVPLPGAHANAPTGGVRAAGTGKAAVGRKAIYAAPCSLPSGQLRLFLYSKVVTPSGLLAGA
uniref:hypothetical protein n=1 Tax=Victivallis vadensis TaxID=172901 RepID=UPI0023F68BD9